MIRPRPTPICRHFPQHSCHPVGEASASPRNTQEDVLPELRDSFVFRELFYTIRTKYISEETAIHTCSLILRTASLSPTMTTFNSKGAVLLHHAHPLSPPVGRERDVGEIVSESSK